MIHSFLIADRNGNQTVQYLNTDRILRIYTQNGGETHTIEFDNGKGGIEMLTATDMPKILLINGSDYYQIKIFQSDSKHKIEESFSDWVDNVDEINIISMTSCVDPTTCEITLTILYTYSS